MKEILKKIVRRILRVANRITDIFLYKRQNYVVGWSLNKDQYKKIKPVSVTLKFEEDCRLGNKNETIEVDFDAKMLKTLLLTGGWQDNIWNFVESSLNQNIDYSVVDVGANMGLFTRQAVFSNLSISKLYCVEPDHKNYDLLVKNTESLDVDIQYFKYALLDEDEKRTLYRDDTNSGNYSLSQSAMPGNFSEAQIEVRDTKRFFNDLEIKKTEHLIYKSDTQGYDCVIFNQLPDSVIGLINLAIIELWANDFAKFNRDEFIARISAFSKIYLGANKKVTPVEVKEFLRLNTNRQADLILIK